MVCGIWLSRCDSHRIFKLSAPVVTRVQRPGDDDSRREWIAVNNRPVAIDWDITSASGDAATSGL
ncbi:hypothetical protein D3C83_160440 [compost metagenome]